MNKRVLITGASRGIGRALALRLGEEGYDLFLVCNRNVDMLEEVAKEIRGFGSDVIVRKCDVGNDAEVRELKEMLDSTGGVYAAVNNAGISYVGLLTDMSYEEWKRVIDVNLSSLFSISKLVIPYMLSKKQGRIINVSSVWGNVGASTEVAYSASKGGVNSFTKALAKELAPSNIAVNAVAFGVIDTDMNKCFSAEEMEALKEEIPADRIATAQEAAEMILKVLESPSYMTGQIITMDGGWT